MITEAQMKKLPAWAQIEMRALKHEAERWQEIAQAIVRRDSNVVLYTGIEEVGLPQNARIRFRVGERGEVADRMNSIDVHVADWQAPDGSLVIQGSSPFNIMPSASNCIYIKPANHFPAATGKKIF